jgi:heat shock protein HslJ
VLCSYSSKSRSKASLLHLEKVMIKQTITSAFLYSLLAACATTNAGVGGGAQDNLAGSTWRLAELQSSDDSIGLVRPDDPSKYEMQLSADGTMTVRLDCNRGRGKWQSPAANQITFPPFAMTRAMCIGASLDTRVARELGYVRSYILDGDRLTLSMMADGGNQVWIRVR